MRGAYPARLFGGPFKQPNPASSNPPCLLTAQIEPVLAYYGADCQPTQIDRVGPGTGFSGAKIWRLTAPRGRLALRRWPNEHPDSARLRFIHDVLGHVTSAASFLFPPRSARGKERVRRVGRPSVGIRALDGLARPIICPAADRKSCPPRSPRWRSSISRRLAFRLRTARRNRLASRSA